MTAASNPPARVLIVDDEPFNVDYLEQELEGLGFETDSATDGFQALQRVAACPPDLILLDVMMPGMDGITALRLIKDDPQTRLVPVVLMTALNSVEDRVRGIEAGADDFLSKPVDERELLARIRTALSHKRAVDATVNELASTSAHLERYGRRMGEVAVAAVRWRLREGAGPAEAVGFVARRHRAGAQQRLREHGGVPSEGDADVLVAAFDGSDERSRTLAAVEAALAVVANDTDGVGVSVGISTGRAEIGSRQVSSGGGARWRYGVEGEPVERASRLAREAAERGVWVTGTAAAAIGDRFRLQPTGADAYRIVGRAPLPHVERKIRTILMTDIVGSTRLAARLGDRAWAELLAAHEQATRTELTRFGGEEINTMGDGFLAAFDSSAQAIRCARAAMVAVEPLGIRLRAGVHTGEVEYLHSRASGLALSVTARVAAQANAGEVLVTGTTRDLAAGSGLSFLDRGERLLHGLSEHRRLYAAVEAPAPTAAGDERELPARLTAREVDVLKLVASGLSDAETAQQLFLSVRTVNAHLRSIYRKLGVRSRAAAGRFAVENALV